MKYKVIIKIKFQIINCVLQLLLYRVFPSDFCKACTHASTKIKNIRVRVIVIQYSELKRSLLTQTFGIKHSLLNSRMTTTTTKASTSYFSNRLDAKDLFTNPSNIQLQDDIEMNGTSEANLSPEQQKIYKRVKRVCIISHKLVELYKMMTYYRKSNLNNQNIHHLVSSQL